MMRQLSIVLAVLCTMSCASWIPGRGSTSFLHDIGRIVLTKQGDIVEVDGNCEVSVKWASMAKLDSTRALIAEGNSWSVRATVVEANAFWVLLESSSWQTRSDLPTEYLNAPDLLINLKKVSGSQGNTRPVVGIPVSQIKEIRLHKNVEVDEPSSMRGSIIAGASGGFLFGISGMLGDSDGEWFPRVPVYDDSPSFVDFLVVGTASAAVGAVALPVYRHWKSQKEQRRGRADDWWGWGKPLLIGQDEYAIKIRR